MTETNKYCNQWLVVWWWQMLMATWRWIGGVYVTGCNNTNGVWLQGHVKQLLVHSGTVAFTVVIQCNQFYHTSEFRHFYDYIWSREDLARTTDRFWKIKSLFGNQNDIFTKFYISVELSAVAKDAVLFGGKIVFQALHFKKDRCNVTILHTVRHGWLHLQNNHIVGKSMNKMQCRC